MDPWGHIIPTVFAEELKKGYDVRPSIAITKAHMRVPEIDESIRRGIASLESPGIDSSYERRHSEARQQICA